MNNKTKKIVFAALFIALAFVGGNIKIMGSIAFDAVPAFLATIVLGWGWGAVVAMIAHMLSAALAGFPLSLPAHLITAVMMGVTMIAFYFTLQACLKVMKAVPAYILGILVAVIFNCPISLLAVAPIFSMPVAVSLIPALLPASVLNVALAVIVYQFLPSNYQLVTPIRKGKKHAAA